MNDQKPQIIIREYARNYGSLSIIFGFIGIFILSFLLSPIAFIFGILALTNKEYIAGIIGILFSIFGVLTSPLLMALIYMPTITYIHFASFFDMNIDEQVSVHQILKHQRDEIVSIDPTVEAFNLGANDGIAAGQSVFHLHIHLFPRRVGDIENPRGGVRGVIPSKQKYVKK